MTTIDFAIFAASIALLFLSALGFVLMLRRMEDRHHIAQLEARNGHVQMLETITANQRRALFEAVTAAMPALIPMIERALASKPEPEPRRPDIIGFARFGGLHLDDLDDELDDFDELTFLDELDLREAQRREAERANEAAGPSSAPSETEAPLNVTTFEPPKPQPTQAHA